MVEASQALSIWLAVITEINGSSVDLTGVQNVYLFLLFTSDTNLFFLVRGLDGRSGSCTCKLKVIVKLTIDIVLCCL